MGIVVVKARKSRVTGKALKGDKLGAKGVAGLSPKTLNTKPKNNPASAVPMSEGDFNEKFEALHPWERIASIRKALKDGYTNYQWMRRALEIAREDSYDLPGFNIATDICNAADELLEGIPDEADNIAEYF